MAVLTERRTAPTDFVLEHTGFGAGSRDSPDRPNCLRAILAQVAEGSSERAGGLLVLQADIDDMSPEYVPGAQEALLAAGALDAVVLPLGMKKGRLGVRLEALVPEPALDGVLSALFRETTTIGARYWAVTRPALERSEEAVAWRGQRVRRTRVRLPGGGERAKPEADDVVRAARATGVPAEQARREIESLGGPPPAPPAGDSTAGEAG